MVAGTLATAGYWTDDNDWEADVYNSKGYFEAFEVQRINNKILFPLIDSPFNLLDTTQSEMNITPDAPGAGWLGLLPLGTKLKLDKTLVPQIQHCLAKAPYCLKDVCFSYTLNLWQPYLYNTKFICVFRHPASTIQSLVHYASQRTYLKTLQLDKVYAQRLWVCIYSHILQRQAINGDWLFIHYDQLFDTVRLDQLAQFAQAKIDKKFPEVALRKPVPQLELSVETMQIYQQLCHRAGFT